MYIRTAMEYWQKILNSAHVESEQNIFHYKLCVNVACEHLRSFFKFYEISFCLLYRTWVKRNLLSITSTGLISTGRLEETSIWTKCIDSKRINMYKNQYKRKIATPLSLFISSFSSRLLEWQTENYIFSFILFAQLLCFSILSKRLFLCKCMHPSVLTTAKFVGLILKMFVR